MLMPDFCTIDNRCLDSWHILVSGQFKHRYPLNISCSKIFDNCKIKRMVTNLTQLGYVKSLSRKIIGSSCIRLNPLIKINALFVLLKICI